MTKPSTGSKRHPPHYDAFTRWWADNVGGLPTPEDVRRFKPRLEREGLLLPEAEYIDRVAADMLVREDAGMPAWDPSAEAKAARARGIELEGTPDFERLVALWKRGQARKGVRGKRADPKAVHKAISAKADARLRKTVRTKPAAAKSSSKVRRTIRLRDETRDRKILQEIHGYLKVGVAVRLTSRKADLVGFPPAPRASRRTATARDALIWSPHWDKASVALRAMAMGIAAAQRQGVDFTAHLGDSGIEYALGGTGDQFARRLYRRIKDALHLNCPKHGFAAPELLFFLEKGVGERPHIHGVIIAPPLKRQQKQLRQILRKAVGTDWKPTARQPTQVEFGALYEPAGWMRYITKYLKLTSASIGENLFASSRGLTRDGRRWYEAHRSTGAVILPGRAVPITKAARP